MIPFAHGVTATVHRATVTTDRYGNDVMTWAAAHSYEGCGFAPRTSNELTDAGRQGVIVGHTLFAPPDADIGPHDRIEVDGDLFEVDGEAGHWRSPFTGWAPGTQVALRRVAG